MFLLEERAKALEPSCWAAYLRSAAPLVAGLAVAAGLQGLFLVLPRGAQFYREILLNIGISVILAVSLTIVNGLTGQFSIGHAGFMSLGAYTSGAIVYYGSWRVYQSPDFSGGILSWSQSLERFTGPVFGSGDLLFLAALLAGGLVAALAGLVVGLPSLRVRGDYLAIVTLGFGEIVRVVLQISHDQIKSPDALRATPFPSLLTHLGGALGFQDLPFYTTLFWVWAFVVITVMVAHRLKHSTYGRAFLSIRENEVAAATMGVPVTRYKVIAFVISAFFAGIAGGLFAHQLGSINASEMAFLKSIDIVIMVVLGGMGSISGAVIAAVVLTLCSEGLRELGPYRMVCYALALIAMMIVRPQGLLGVHEVWDLPWLRRRHKPPQETPA